MERGGNMLKARVFIFALIFVSIAGAVSAAGISINPNPVSLGHSANISINIHSYRCYLYFYQGKTLVTSILLGDGDSCSGNLFFSYPFPESLFPAGNYSAYVFSLDSSSYVSFPFSVVSSATTASQQNTPSACTPSAYSKEQLCQGYLCGEVSNGTCGSVSCGSCSTGYVCNKAHICAPSFNSSSLTSVPPIGPNEKNDSLYTPKTVFLLSDSDWKEVLPFVSAAVWTDSSGNVQKYPFLVWHNESTGFDADSAIYFMQQYSPDKVNMIGDTPSNLDSLLVAASPVGAGVPIGDINRYSPQSYIDFWKSFDSVVYVPNNYDAALMASTYASLINAPLVVAGSSLDTSSVLSGRDLICVGQVPISVDCSERYTVEQLQDKYKSQTNAKDVILVNPSDWNAYFYEGLSLQKSYYISHLYTKTSLLAPVLASARHELLLSDNTPWDVNNTLYEPLGNSQKVDLTNKFYSWNYQLTYQGIGKYIHSQLSGMDSLTIMASPYAIPIFLPNSDLFVASQVSPGVSLDPYYYADLDGDGKPDVAVGRIAGMSTSDVSGYIARDLFYGSFQKTNNVKLFGSSFGGTLANLVNNMVPPFRDAGYNAVAKTSSEDAYQFNPDDWENQDMIFYADHGADYWAGIYSTEIPLLNNTLVDSAACDNVASYDSYSFWAHVIKQGSVGFLGAVSTTGLNTLNLDFLNNIYKNGDTLGEAFKSAYRSNFGILQEPVTLIGDPLLDINPAHRASQTLSANAATLLQSSCQKTGGTCFGSRISCCAGSKCSWFSCQTCLVSGTSVNLPNQNLCCNDWHWITKQSANFCGWCANGASACLPWDWRIGFSATYCGTHTSNDHKECT